jgi:hypothetical protein
MRLGNLVLCLPVLAALAGLAGCNKMAGILGFDTGNSPMDLADDRGGQDHGPGEHPVDEHAADAHEHGAGPHGGTITEWGAGDYLLEFTVDHDAKEAVVYVLGGDLATATPVAAVDGTLLLTIREPAFQVELAAWPMDGEADGMASRYRGSHENLGIVREFAGTISGAVGDTPYAGDFSEDAHEH